MSLYGTFERLPLMGALASSSIVFSAAYTMYLYNRISFGGAYSAMLSMNIPDLNIREFGILIPLVLLIVVFGIYTQPILDGIHYNVSQVIYNITCQYNIIECEGITRASISPEPEPILSTASISPLWWSNPGKASDIFAHVTFLCGSSWTVDGVPTNDLDLRAYIRFNAVPENYTDVIDNKVSSLYRALNDAMLVDRGSEYRASRRQILATLDPINFGNAGSN